MEKTLHEAQGGLAPLSVARALVAVEDAIHSTAADKETKIRMPQQTFKSFTKLKQGFKRCIRSAGVEERMQYARDHPDEKDAVEEEAPSMIACSNCHCRPIGVPYYECQDCPKRFCAACEKMNDAILDRYSDDLVAWHDPKHVTVKYRVYAAHQ